MRRSNWCEFIHQQMMNWINWQCSALSGPIKNRYRNSFYFYNRFHFEADDETFRGNSLHKYMWCLSQSRSSDFFTTKDPIYPFCMADPFFLFPRRLLLLRYFCWLFWRLLQWRSVSYPNWWAPKRAFRLVIDHECTWSFASISRTLTHSLLSIFRFRDGYVSEH